jgi:hypothetical protein
MPAKLSISGHAAAAVTDQVLPLLPQCIRA